MKFKWLFGVGDMTKAFYDEAPKKINAWIFSPENTRSIVT